MESSHHGLQVRAHDRGESSLKPNIERRVAEGYMYDVFLRSSPAILCVTASGVKAENSLILAFA